MDIVFLAGGKGSRLWPMSRKGLPKHLLSIFGERSLFQDTILRAMPLLEGDDQMVIVTNTEQERLLSQQMENIGVDMSRVRFLIEPVGRNTAPAVTWAVLELMAQGHSGPVLMLPCDHLIPNVDVFVEQMKICAEFVQKEKTIVVFGIRPSYPSTGYGYIHVDEARKRQFSREEFFPVQAFKEKPDSSLAREYLKRGDYFWNSGMLMFDLDKFLSEAERYMSELVRDLKEMIASDNKSRIYENLESISLDYALLEKTSDLWCMAARFHWSDMGSWAAVYEMQDKDKDGNAVVGQAVILDSQNNLVIGPKNKVIGLINQRNIVVVDTPDALLICGIEDVQKVKKIASCLEETQNASWTDPARVERGWGYYVVLDKGARFKTKRIVVYPGKALSLQRHQHRSEHWVVLQGVAKVWRGDEVFYVHPNESTYIPVGVKHKLENPGKIPLEIIEVQNGDYLEEDDIERFD